MRAGVRCTSSNFDDFTSGCGEDGNARDPRHVFTRTKLEQEKHHHKAPPAPATHRAPQAAVEVHKKEPELPKEHEKPKVRKAADEPAPGHDAKSRRKRMVID
jgi:hypothetical protein